MNADESPSLIDLAHEAAFALGGMEVRPSTRELVAAGRQELMEPRIMQVLVALARRRGQVVSRDDLINLCWGGRAVGEDAINRCISAIRKLSEAHGGFVITTVARVGYRLDESALPFAKPALPLLAVLAFDNLSSGDDMTWFSDGVSEEIWQTLVSGTDVMVIARSSSFQFRDAGKAVRHVAAELGTTHVLDGSVRRSGSRVRVLAHLVECATETTLWSDRFDRDLSDIFAVQDDIAQSVARALKRVFAPAAKSEAINPAAHDLYLKARRMAEAILDSAGYDQVIDLLEQATSLAPRFARAWAVLASMRAAQFQRGDSGQSFARLRASVVAQVNTALEIDPDLGSCYQTLAQLEPFRHYAERESLHEKALATTPNDPEVLTRAGIFSAEVGRIHEALARVKRAVDLDPVQFGAAYGYASFAAFSYASFLEFDGRYQESRAQWDKFRRRWPGNQFIRLGAIASAAQNADWLRFDGLIEALPASQVESETVRRLQWFARNLRDPDPQSLTRGLERQRQRIDRTGTVALDQLISLHKLGLTEQTFELIDQATFAYVNEPEYIWPISAQNISVIFGAGGNGAMVKDPRFVRLCAKLGLCDYWVKTDRWPDCADDRVLPYDFRAECRRLAGAAA